MEMEVKRYGAHVLALSYPSQGHINPMLQFCKRLVSKGLKATLLITNFISTSMNPKSTSVRFDTISDGYDEGGFMQAANVQAYLETLQSAGSKSLSELLDKYKKSGIPIDCVIYDAFCPWALDVTKEAGLVGAAFFTQPCAVNYIYYYAYHGLLTLPVDSGSLPVSIPGLPLLELQDLPSFIYVHGSYPAYFKLVLNQFLKVEKADYIFVNTFYKLEVEMVDTMSKLIPLITIGPTIPSFFLDNEDENDKEYGLNLFHLGSSNPIITWLNTKPKGSVVYVGFGSMANLSEDQMEELAWGLKESNYNFLWVVRDSEEAAKLPKNFAQKMAGKGLLVTWSPQLEVLSNEAVGCFFSHSGWNSTIEALSLGVPMVVMPQWTDQTTNAKLVQDVWKVGIRVRVDEKGVVGREEIEYCIREVMEGNRGKEMKDNAMKWKGLAKEAVSEGGTTDKNIDQFVSKLSTSSSHI
uniref:Glycosyltransferase n=1 Tax=Panax ginseng TaxID=4054 RepID=A0A0D5ZCS3_PANGI|nr:UGTPg35 [Panax ginseng]